jgi:hypothetical protein
MRVEYAISTTKVTMSTRIFFPVLLPPHEICSIRLPQCRESNMIVLSGQPDLLF